MTIQKEKIGIPAAAGLLLAAAPLLHFATDIAELAYGGFGSAQLAANYAAFIMIPFALIGLALYHEPKAGTMMYAGAFLYGIAFIYFAFTSMYAIVADIRDYHSLWLKLGTVYTFHGGLMVIGGVLCGISVFLKRKLPRWTAVLFLSGLLLNTAITFLPLPETAQIAGSTIRNAGLISMGIIILIRETR